MVRVRPGILGPADAEELPRWQRRQQQALIAVAALGHELSPDVVFSHQSAALIHGLWQLHLPEATHVTQPSKPSGRRTPRVVRHSGALDDSEVTTVNGLRVTTIQRTIVDCARLLHPREGLVIADGGMRALVRPDRTARAGDDARIAVLRESLMASVGSGRGPARRRPRAVIQHADPRAESPRESVLRWIVVARGLMAPTVQLPLVTRRGTYYADLGWHLRSGEESWILLLEYDGRTKYGAGLDDGADDPAVTSSVLLAERKRENIILEEIGAKVVRVDRDDIRHEDEVFRRVCRKLPARLVADLEPIPELLYPY